MEDDSALITSELVGISLHTYLLLLCTLQWAAVGFRGKNGSSRKPLLHLCHQPRWHGDLPLWVQLRWWPACSHRLRPLLRIQLYFRARWLQDSCNIFFKLFYVFLMTVNLEIWFFSSLLKILFTLGIWQFFISLVCRLWYWSKSILTSE